MNVILYIFLGIIGITTVLTVAEIILLIIKYLILMI